MDAVEFARLRMVATGALYRCCADCRATLLQQLEGEQSREES